MRTRTRPRPRPRRCVFELLFRSRCALAFVCQARSVWRVVCVWCWSAAVDPLIQTWSHIHCCPRPPCAPCRALHCTALHCTALHGTARHCTALHGTARHCTALHCTALLLACRRFSFSHSSPSLAYCTAACCFFVLCFCLCAIAKPAMYGLTLAQCCAPATGQRLINGISVVVLVVFQE